MAKTRGEIQQASAAKGGGWTFPTHWSVDLPGWIPHKERTEAHIAYGVLLSAWGEARLDAAITQFIDSLMQDGFDPADSPFPGSPASALWTISKRVVKDIGISDKVDGDKHAGLLKTLVETIIASYLEKDEGLEWLLDPRSLGGLKWLSWQEKTKKSLTGRKIEYPSNKSRDAALMIKQQGRWKTGDPLTKLLKLVCKHLGYKYVEGKYKGGRAVYEHLRALRKTGDL